MEKRRKESKQEQEQKQILSCLFIAICTCIVQKINISFHCR